MKGYAMIKNLKRTNKFLLISTVFMFIFGLLMIFSASYVRAIDFMNTPYYYVLRHGMILGVCLVTFLILINFPLKLYKKNYKFIMLLGLALLLLTRMFGFVVNGAQNWLNFGYFNFQASEFVKIGSILYLAAYFDKIKDNKDNIWKTLYPYIGIVISFVLIAMQPDLGSALILLIISAAMLLAVPKYPKIKKSLFKFTFVGLIGVVIMLLIIVVTGKSFLFSYQSSRFNIANPCQRYTEVGTGYQVCNAYIAINNGGLFGSGFGDSTQKYLYLPEAWTDAIFPIIVEECGLIVSILLLVLYALIIIKILKIGKKSHTLYNGLICYGVAAYMFTHIMVNLMGIFGLIPLTGVPLPFLSYGGSYALCLTIGLTLVQRVNIENRVHSDEQIIKNKIKEI